MYNQTDIQFHNRLAFRFIYRFANKITQMNKRFTSLKNRTAKLKTPENWVFLIKPIDKQHFGAFRVEYE